MRGVENFTVDSKLINFDAYENLANFAAKFYEF